jgi:hypothetical protein
LLVIALLTITPLLHAQQVGSNSPYGRYGYGLLVKPSVGASESMGGISYGLRRSQHVNPGNPASYSKLDSLTFIFDFGISGHYSRLNDGTNKQDFYNGNFDYVAIQFPLFRKMGASVGLQPYSKVGYNFGTGRSLSNIQYSEVYRGTGGLNQIYVGAAWEPLQYLSVGANLSYLFGNFSYSSVVIPRSAASSALVGETKQEFSIRDLKYDMGVQLTYPVSRTKSVTLGMVYSPRLRMRTDVNPSEKLYVSDPYQNPWQSPAQVLTTDTLRDAEFHLPNTLGVGITYQTSNLLVGVDGTYEGWKGMAYPDKLDELTKEERFNDVFRVNAGFEYVADPYSPNFFQRVRFRGGLSYGNSYVNVNVFNPTRNDQQIGTGSFKDLSVNVGLGLPMHDLRTGHVSMVNIGFGYTRQQPDTDHMVKQDMFKVSVSMNINEFWFFKRQFH